MICWRYSLFCLFPCVSLQVWKLSHHLWLTCFQHRCADPGAEKSSSSFSALSASSYRSLSQLRYCTMVKPYPNTAPNTQRILIVEEYFKWHCICMTLFFVVQGGVYLFQLVDYYGANGACILFVSLFQCVAVGWAFGKWYQFFSVCSVFSLVNKIQWYDPAICPRVSDSSTGCATGTFSRNLGTLNFSPVSPGYMFILDNCTHHSLHPVPTFSANDWRILSII